jgi:hypothetical protein
MHTFDDSLLHLTVNGHLSLEEALLNARHPDTLQEEFQNRLRAQAAAKR